MKEKQCKKKGLITFADNQKIVELIKAKINPIQRKLNKTIPKDLISTAPNFFHKRNKQYDIIDKQELRQYEISIRQTPIELVKRAQEYIHDKRKNMNENQKSKKIVDLKIYTRLFDDTAAGKQNAVSQFLKMKRESKMMMSFYDKPNQPKIIQNMAFQHRTEEEESEMNAKIRKKLNHRKLISLYRYT